MSLPDDLRRHAMDTTNVLHGRALNVAADEVERLTALLEGRTMSCSQCNAMAEQVERLTAECESLSVIAAGAVANGMENDGLRSMNGCMEGEVERLTAQLAEAERLLRDIKDLLSEHAVTESEWPSVWTVHRLIDAFLAGAACPTCNGTGGVPAPDVPEAFKDYNPMVPCPDCGEGR